MAIVDQSAVEAILQINFDQNPEPRVDELIAQITDEFRGHLGREIDPAIGSLTATIDVPAGAVRLLTPHWPLATVTDVTEAGTALTVTDDYLVDLETGTITRVSSGALAYWSSGPAAVDVTYTIATPAGLRALAAKIIARAWRAGATFANAPKETLGFRQLTVGRWSATVDGAVADVGRALELTDDDLRKLDRWRDRRP